MSMLAGDVCRLFLFFSAQMCVTAFCVVQAFEHAVRVELLRLVAFGATIVRLLFFLIIPRFYLFCFSAALFFVLFVLFVLSKQGPRSASSGYYARSVSSLHAVHRPGHASRPQHGS